MWIFWRQSRLSEAEQEITDSIKALKTLEVHEGRVSISPLEVLGQPGYLEARRHAAKLVTCHQKLRRFDTWADVDTVGMYAYMDYIRKGLLRKRADGLSLRESLQHAADGFGLKGCSCEGSAET